MRKSWLIICLLNFLAAATMGLLLRFVNLFPLGINYQYLIHGHSHVAMLGWIYMMIFCLFVHHFVPKEKRRKYNILFWVTQTAVTGMIISFPIQGYALFSIAFSTMHILCSYVFCYWIWRDNNIVSTSAKSLVKASLLFMLLSTVGAWSLGIVARLAGKQSPLYKSAIQFFLHFQFNGWFVIAVLALFFTLLAKSGIIVNKSRFRIFYYLLLASTIFTLALPLGWYYSHPALPYFNALGTAMQLAALALFFKLVFPAISVLYEKASASAKWLMTMALFSFAVKIIMQIAVIMPELAAAAHKVRNLTLAFIHLAMLGMITGFLFYFLAATDFIQAKNRFWKAGIFLFCTGFISTELLLAVQGIRTFFITGEMENYHEILFIASTLLPAGLISILISAINPSPRMR